MRFSQDVRSGLYKPDPAIVMAGFNANFNQNFNQNFNGDSPAGGAPGRATIAMSNVTTSSTTTDAATFSSASFTPVVGQVYFFAVCSVLASGDPPTPTLTHDGFTTFTQIDSVRLATQPRRMTTFWAVCTSAVADVLDMAYGATQSSALWSIITGTGIDSAAPATQFTSVNNASSVTTPSPAPTLAAFEHPNNVNLSLVMLAANGTVTADPDFALLGTIGVSGGTGGVGSLWAANQLTCEPTWTASGYIVTSVEVKAA